MTPINQLIWIKTFETYMSVTPTDCELAHICLCFNESVSRTRRGGFVWTHSCIVAQARRSEAAAPGRGLI